MMLIAMLATLSQPAALPREAEAKPATMTAAVATIAPAKAKPVRYCFNHVEEDHILRGKVCRTRAQWLWRNIDPLDYLNQTKK
ncbi:hypothetical protein ACQKJZ_17470 [Sphingomonas sp. NPDC019816]|uniref:hypothetical protein n=1 Tax=Sphingomonas sp. NPDC019816 TaxID=3390679 RepID=UPI003CFC3C20